MDALKIYRADEKNRSLFCSISLTFMGLSSETPRVSSRDRVGDLPLWTARGVGNSPYNFLGGMGNFLFE